MLMFSKLQDLNMKGKLLTWSNRQCGAKRIRRRLDRAFVNAEWNAVCTSAWAMGLTTDTSDHSPIIIRWNKQVDWAGKPFLYCQLWKNKVGFEEVVLLGWGSPISGNPQFKLMNKLQTVKGNLKQWKVQFKVNHFTSSVGCRWAG